MPIVHIFVVLIVIGVLLWLVNNYIPMDGRIKQLVNGLAIILIVLWLLSVLLGFSLATARI